MNPICECHKGLEVTGEGLAIVVFILDVMHILNDHTSIREQIKGNLLMSLSDQHAGTFKINNLHGSLYFLCIANRLFASCVHQKAFSENQLCTGAVLGSQTINILHSIFYY